MDEQQAQGGKGNSASAERRGRLYGRKWKILIFKPAYLDNGEIIKTRDPEHDIAIDVSLLRCVFKTQQRYQTQATTCTLEIYNMNATTEGDIIESGFQISIEAGYDEGQYGEIFTGDIVQVIRNRENGVDYKLEILALRGTALFDMNHTRAKIAAGSTPRDIIKAATGYARQRIEVGEISENLSKQALPRGKVLFGTPAKYLRDLAIGNDAYYWEGEDGKLTVKKTIDEIPEDRCLVLTPATGLIGTPQYGDQGITIKMLMDCRIKLKTLIKIDNELIRRQLIALDLTKGGAASGGQAPQQSIFDQDGEYMVINISHCGDTYGDDWVTEVIGMGRNGPKGLTTNQESPDQSEKE